MSTQPGLQEFPITSKSSNQAAACSACETHRGAHRRLQGALWLRRLRCLPHMRAGPARQWSLGRCACDMPGSLSLLMSCSWHLQESRHPMSLICAIPPACCYEERGLQKAQGTCQTLLQRALDRRDGRSCCCRRGACCFGAVRIFLACLHGSLHGARVSFCGGHSRASCLGGLSARLCGRDGREGGAFLADDSRLLRRLVSNLCVGSRCRWRRSWHCLLCSSAGGRCTSGSAAALARQDLGLHPARWKEDISPLPPNDYSLLEQQGNRPYLHKVGHRGEALVLGLVNSDARGPHAAARHADGGVADPALRAGTHRH